MGTDLAVQKGRLELSATEQALICGNLAALTDVQRLELYGRVCESLGLNPLTKPFDYIILNNKMTLYAKRDCTDQLRRAHGVSIVELTDKTVNDVYIVKARAQTSDGRSDTSTGAVSIKGLAGEALCNALMKAETKAKRRVTLSVCGLGFLDETEAESLVASGAAHEPDFAQAASEPAPAPPPLTAEQKVADKAEFTKRCESMGYEGRPDVLLCELLGMTAPQYMAHKNKPRLMHNALALGAPAWNEAVDRLWATQKPAEPTAEAGQTEQVPIEMEQAA